MGGPAGGPGAGPPLRFEPPLPRAPRRCPAAKIATTSPAAPSPISSQPHQGIWLAVDFPVVDVVVAGVTCTLVVLLATEVVVGAALTVSVRVTVCVGSVTVRVSVVVGVVVVGEGSELVELLTNWATAVEALCPACVAFVLAPDPHAAISQAVANPAASAAVTLATVAVNRISSWWSS